MAQKRDERTTWATPLAVTHGGKTEIVVSASQRVRSYDLENGSEIWQCGGMTANVIPSPLTGHGLIYAISGFRGNALRAIKIGRTGDLTGTDGIAWSYDTKTPYVPSPPARRGSALLLFQTTRGFCHASTPRRERC